MSSLLAFPGAEGYGAMTVGGRGGQVVTVTSLADDGPGTLRWALEDVKGPRTIVFEVSGTITLKSQILIENPYVTIAGQTAPGDGVTLEGARIRVKADEVIIRGLHFRPGDGAVGMTPGDRDGLFIGTTDFQIDNVVVDHNSFSWGVDENVSINGNVHNVTFSNNIVAEALSKSIHPEGEHSKGFLISNWSSLQSDYNAKISVVKNLFASNMARNPEVRAGQQVDIVNNYIYNFGSTKAISVGGGSDGKLVITVNVIGNVFEAGPSTSSSALPVGRSGMQPGSAVYLSDNLFSRLASDAAGNQAQSQLFSASSYITTTSPAFTSNNVAVMDSTQVKAYVLANAGARPDSPDAVDARIVASAANNVGAMVNSLVQVGGRFAATFAAPPADGDRDGMPDWFENAYGLNKSVFDANGDNDGDGYTNLEEYINGLYTGFDFSGREAAAAKVSDLGTGGDDVITGAALNDFLRGAEGNDSMSGGGGFDDMHGNMGSDTLRGEDGDDWVVGGKDQDLLYGDAGADIVYGNMGADSCYGGAGADWVRGGQDDDLLFGNDGDDWMAGDRGSDTLSGGSGADTFYIFDGSGLDRITDFNRAEGDRVQLAPGQAYTVSQVGADTVIDLGGGDQLVLVGVSTTALTTGWLVQI